jgi:hypothetical protein
VNKLELDFADIRGFSLLTQRKSVEKLEKKDELLG